MTKEVIEQAPKEIQLRCWQLIDEKVIQLCYLQLFEFNRED
ncbi:DUF960 family protein [Enterococcus hulanensis]|nr:DUF960 family protein [Enterococcus hulanensis]